MCTGTTSFIEILMHRPTDCLDLPLPIKQSRIIIKVRVDQWDRKACAHTYSKYNHHIYVISLH